MIEPSGHKSWQMRFRRPDGRPAKLTLGPFDTSGREQKGDPIIGQPLTLASARWLATDVHRRRAQGKDVIGDEKAAKSRKRTEMQEHGAKTFATQVASYIARQAQKKTRDWRSTARLLGLHYGEDGKAEVIRGGLVARWGDRLVTNIDTHTIAEVIDEARESAVPGIKARNDGESDARARALFVALSSLFSWLQRHRKVGINPCGGCATSGQCRDARPRSDH